ncbi:Hypothetical protein NTJ_03149 [Nesidiocoris tenuis]|uniref:Secreted protein n=1 Tax=Nesidiocoris tenuis TaxID=355587 RepID=A0ABN7ADJ3_9HEMI|nr:Hypothetical protein NTJ_03149 [Nesidiocoris tenuis]
MIVFPFLFLFLRLCEQLARPLARSCLAGENDEATEHCGRRQRRVWNGKKVLTVEYKRAQLRGGDCLEVSISAARSKRWSGYRSACMPPHYVPIRVRRSKRQLNEQVVGW